MCNILRVIGTHRILSVYFSAPGVGRSASSGFPALKSRGALRHFILILYYRNKVLYLQHWHIKSITKLWTCGLLLFIWFTLKCIVMFAFYRQNVIIDISEKLEKNMVNIQTWETKTNQYYGFSFVIQHVFLVYYLIGYNEYDINFY